MSCVDVSLLFLSEGVTSWQHSRGVGVHGKYCCKANSKGNQYVNKKPPTRDNRNAAIAKMKNSGSRSSLLFWSPEDLLLDILPFLYMPELFNRRLPCTYMNNLSSSSSMYDSFTFLNGEKVIDDGLLY